VTQGGHPVTEERSHFPKKKAEKTGQEGGRMGAKRRNVTQRTSHRLKPKKKEPGNKLSRFSERGEVTTIVKSINPTSLTRWQLTGKDFQTLVGTFYRIRMSQKTSGRHDIVRSCCQKGKSVCHNGKKKPVSESNGLSCDTEEESVGFTGRMQA